VNIKLEYYYQSNSLKPHYISKHTIQKGCHDHSKAGEGQDNGKVLWPGVLYDVVAPHDAGVVLEHQGQNIGHPAQEPTTYTGPGNIG